MKIRYYLPIALVCALTLGCQKTAKTVKSKDEVLGDFARSVLIAGKANDCETLVSKLSMCTVAKGTAFMDQLKKANPELTFTDGKKDPTDAGFKKEVEANARLFVDSYEGVFDGKLTSVIRSQDTSLKGVNVCSMIIWAKHTDGKYRGIKIDNLLEKDDGTFEVLTWVHISGYDASKNIQKKKALLERDTLEECNYPNMIEYQCVYVN